MHSRGFSRRQLFKKMAGVAGVAGLMVVGAGCQSIQDALGPKTGGAGGGAATLRYMGHFTALGDTARDRAQKQIDTKFKEKFPNITVQWEQTAWETIGEKFMAAWSAGTAPDISLFGN